VVALEPAARRVVVGPRAALARDLVRVAALNWLDAAPLGPEGRRVEVKLRSAQAPAAATLFPAGADGAEVALDAPLLGVSPGQAAVFYDRDRVLGGGWIAAAGLRAAAACGGDGGASLDRPRTAPLYRSGGAPKSAPADVAG
jgi:tRNA-specific 2-thiouridylase